MIANMLVRLKWTFYCLSFLFLICMASWNVHSFIQKWVPDFEQNENLALDEDGIVSIVANAISHSQYLNQEQPWLEYSLQQMPIVLTFDNQHVYAFNLKSDNPAWHERTLDDVKYLYSPTDNWGISVLQLQNKYYIDGTSAFVYHMDIVKQDVLQPIIAMLHERFHLYQSEHFSGINKQSEGYVDHLNPYNLALMQIEEMILADFMNGQLDNEKSFFHKSAPLLDYLAVNKERQKYLQPISQNWERNQQKFQGIADYVAYKSLEIYPFVNGFSGTKRLLAFLQSSSVNEEILERTVRCRHNKVGATLAYALDFITGDDWKEPLQESDRSPTELLAEQIILSDEEAEARLAKIKARYGYDNVWLQVTEAIQHYKEEIADLLEEYDQLEGVELSIEKPKEDPLDESTSSLYMYYLHDGSILTLADTSKLTSYNGKWDLSITGAPMVIKTIDGEIKLKADPKTTIKLDNRTLALSSLIGKDQEISFSELSFECNQCNIKTVKNGKLTVKGNKVTLSF